MTHALPPARQPFPVKVPFTTGVDLHKLGRPLLGVPEDTVFLLEDHAETVIGAKLAALAQIPAHSLVYLDDDLPGLTAALWRVAERVAAEHPAWATLDADGFTSRLTGVRLGRGAHAAAPSPAAFPALGAAVQAHLAPLTGVRRLAAGLLLSVQEDLVIVRNTAGTARGDVAEALLVALPSHWDPAAKLGQSFGAIHAPVGDNERLLAAHPRLVAAMVEKGPFVRYNWSLASVTDLCQNPVWLDGHSLAAPDLVGLSPGALVGRLVFRVERQTLLPMPDLGRALFAIGIYQRPLVEVAREPEHAARIADAVASMSAAQLAYRAMTEIAAPLVAGLRALA